MSGKNIVTQTSFNRNGQSAQRAQLITFLKSKIEYYRLELKQAQILLAGYQAWLDQAEAADFLTSLESDFPSLAGLIEVRGER